eukprot:scaffold10655_cov51-Cyclotella_meneghiniana.AAC.2
MAMVYVVSIRHCHYSHECVTVDGGVSGWLVAVCATSSFFSVVAGTMNILRKEEKDPFELLAIVSKITRNLSSEKVCQQSSVRR